VSKKYPWLTNTPFPLQISVWKITPANQCRINKNRASSKATRLFLMKWRDSFICVTWLIHMRDVTHSYVWRDSFICVTWLIHMCDVTHSYVWRDSFICVTWLIHICDVTHSYVWRDIRSKEALYWFVTVARLQVLCIEKIVWYLNIYSYLWKEQLTNLWPCCTLRFVVFKK